LNEVIETHMNNSDLKFELVQSELKMIEDKIDQKVDKLDISVIINNTHKLRDMIAKFDLNSEETQILTISRHIDIMKLDLQD